MAMPGLGAYSVRAGNPAAGAGSAAVEAFQRARSLGIQEDEAMLRQMLALRALQEKFADDRAVAAAMGQPDETVQYAPERTLAGPIIEPARPGVYAPDFGGNRPQTLTLPPGIGAPPGQEDSSLLPETTQITEPVDLRADAVMPPQAAVRGPDVQVPAVTEQVPTMAGLRRSLAADPAAMAALARPAAQAAIKTRGVVSDEEIKYRQGLTEIEQEAKRLADEARGVLDQGSKGALTEADVIKMTVSQAGYYQRVASVLARRDPGAAAQARQQSQQLFNRAIELQKADVEERKLAPADLGSFAKALAVFNAPGGQNRENLQAIFQTIAGFQSKYGRALAQQVLQQSMQKAIERLDDQRYQGFFTAMLASMQAQAADHGKVDRDQAVQDAIRAFPEQALTMMGDKGPVGSIVRQSLFGREVRMSEVELAREEVDAEIRTSPDPNLRALRPDMPGYWARIRSKANEGRGRDRDDIYRDNWNLYRDHRSKVQDDVRLADRDLRALETEQRSGRSDRDPAEIARDVQTARERRDRLARLLKDMQPPRRGQAYEPPPLVDEPVEPPAAPAPGPMGLGQYGPTAPPVPRTPQPSTLDQGAAARARGGGAPVAPATPATPPPPAASDPITRATQRLRELRGQGIPDAEIRETLIREGLAKPKR